MKKKWIALATTVGMVMTMVIPTMAATNATAYETARIRPDFTIMIDGKEKNFKRSDGSAAHPLVYEGSTYLPLRAIGEALGKNVNWNEETKTITLEGKREATASSNQEIAGTAEDVSVQVRKDFTIIIDGKVQNFRTSAGKEIYPLLLDGSTYLPLRAIGQIMDKTVEWDADTKTVTLKSNGYTVIDADSFGNKNTVTDADSFQSVTGTKDKDIGAEKAKEIALRHAGVAAANAGKMQVEKDYDDGMLKYEVEFENGRTEYEYEINAKTGEIIKAEKEYDD